MSTNPGFDEVQPPPGIHEDLYDDNEDPENPCRVPLFPEDSILSMTKSVAGRWEKAMGCDVYIDVTGISIAYSPLESFVCVSVAYDKDGEVSSLILNSRVPECSTMEVTLLHEIGHIICDTGSAFGHCHVLGLDPTEDDHVLMSASDAVPKIDYIDERSLQSICDSVECSAFVPEGP